MSLRWDADKVAEMRRRLAPLGDGGFRRVVYRLLAEEAHHLIRLGFRKSEDPYGKPWKGAFRRGRMLTQGQILRDTGRLQNSFSANATNKGFSVETDVKYAAIHNFGGPIIRKGQVNAHGKNGRFTSLRKAALGKAKVQRISFTAAHGYKMPQRQMVPDPARLPKSWDMAFGEVLEDALKRQFRGVR